MTDWDAYARSNLQNTHTMFEREPVQHLRSQAMGMRAKGTTLDVGGGDGYQAEMMRDEGAKVTVLDISQIRVQRAIDKGFDARTGDACALPYEDDSFDTVVLGEIVEHLSEPGEALSEAFRVAKERVVVSLPLNGWSDPTHLWRVTLDHLIDPDDKDPTKGEQIVLTFQRGECWPTDYHLTDSGWIEQMAGR